MFLSCRPFVVITTKGLQDRNIHILDGTMVENKGKLIVTKYFVCPTILLYDISGYNGREDI